MSDFASTLRGIRLERGMTQEEFATFLGTSKQNISRYENGEVSPKISTAAKIAETLGVTLTQLNGGDNATHGYNNVPASEQERQKIVAMFTQLTEKNQAKLLDYAQLLLTAQKTAVDSRG